MTSTKNVDTAPEPRKRILTPAVKLSNLYDKIGGDPELHHLRYRRKLVTGHGPIDPIVMIVVEMPEAQDERIGVSMTGPSGVVLGEMLATAELKRVSHAFVTPIVKYRPTAGREATEVETRIFLGYLGEEVSYVNPRYIVTCGRYVNRCFFPDIPFAELKGTKQTWRKRMVLPTVDPMTALHDRTSRQVMQETFRMLGDMV